MTEKAFLTKAPFGVATKRFTKIGFHPQLDISGAMKKQVTNAGPGTYNPNKPPCMIKSMNSWKRKQELEDFSKNLNYRNADILQRRARDKTMRGPGSYDIESPFLKKSASIKRNTGLGGSERLVKNFFGNIAPPPNHYFTKMEFEPAKKTFSTKSTFGFQQRFRSEMRSYHLPVNIYKVNDGKNICDITKKVVSTRGPYELFTGPRDETTIKNGLVGYKEKNPEYFFVEPTSLDLLLTHPRKKRYGVFLKGKRFTRPTERHLLNDLSMCYRDPAEPGPATYPLKSSIGVTKPCLQPFNCTIPARPPKDWKISPGPGRYHPRAPRCDRSKRPSWVFLAKSVPRDNFGIKDYGLLS